MPPPLWWRPAKPIRSKKPCLWRSAPLIQARRKPGWPHSSNFPVAALQTAEELATRQAHFMLLLRPDSARGRLRPAPMPLAVEAHKNCVAQPPSAVSIFLTENTGADRIENESGVRRAKLSFE